MGGVDSPCNELVSSGLSFVLQKQNQLEVYVQEDFYFHHKPKQQLPSPFLCVYTISVFYLCFLLHLSYFWGFILVNV